MTTLNSDLRVSHSLTLGSLGGLALLKGLMLAGLYSRTEPHPPEFLSPFLSATLAVAALAGILLLLNSRHFIVPALAFGLASLLSYGPHKLYPGDHPFFFAQSPATYPAIVTGSILIAMLILSALRLHNSFREH